MSHLSRVHSLSRNRQAVRRFADRQVPPDLLERILDCGRFAVSAGEDQPWRVIVVQDDLFILPDEDETTARLNGLAEALARRQGMLLVEQVADPVTRWHSWTSVIPATSGKPPRKRKLLKSGINVRFV